MATAILLDNFDMLHVFFLSPHPPAPFFKKASTNSIWKQPFQTENWNFGRQRCQTAAIQRWQKSLASWQEETDFYLQGACTGKWQVSPSSLLASSRMWEKQSALPITSGPGKAESQQLNSPLGNHALRAACFFTIFMLLKKEIHINSPPSQILFII